MPELLVDVPNPNVVGAEVDDCPNRGAAALLAGFAASEVGCPPNTVELDVAGEPKPAKPVHYISYLLQK